MQLKSFLSALTLTSAMLLAGCGGPRSLTVPMLGVAPLNPNEAKESTPVDVRIWPLAGADRFKAATVDQLWTDAKTVLGADLLADAKIFTVFPGAASDPMVEQRLDVPSNTQFIGVLAMYQFSDAQDQRATVVPIDDIEDHGLILTGFAVRLHLPEPATTAAPAPAAAAPAK